MDRANPDYKLIEEVLRSSSSLSKHTVTGLKELPRQASARRFLRATLAEPRVSKDISVILMITGAASGPAFIPASPKNPEESFVELASFFAGNSVQVPNLLFFDSNRHVVVLEDVGEWPLYRFAGACFGREKIDDAIEEVVAGLGEDDPLIALWKRAIDIIARIQAIPFDPKALAFQRTWRVDNYLKEAGEFLDYIARPKNINEAAALQLRQAFDGLSETVADFPQKLSHFDFISHNLHVDAAGQIRVLDFQDACLASPVRDLVALCNCRGSDELLGPLKHAKLLEYYKQVLSVRDNFHDWFDLTSLHWDLRVSGRFQKLSIERGLKFYEQWIPGTLRRLGRTLARTYHRLHLFEDVIEICSKISPEIKDGVECAAWKVIT